MQTPSFRTFLTVFACLSLPASVPHAEAQSPNSLVTIHEGHLPVILTAPHGGRDSVPGVPLRTGNGVGQFKSLADAFTAQLTEKIADAMEAKTGRRPYVVIAGFHRKYIDANRRPDQAFESEKARPAYDRYHEAIRKARRQIVDRWGQGLLLDVHGQGSEPEAIFRGTQNGRTIGHSMSRLGKSVLSGSHGFFGRLAANGFHVIPKVGSVEKEHDRYDGGYTVWTYGSRDGLPFDAIQLELGRRLRSPDVNSNTADAIADSIIEYMGHFESSESNVVFNDDFSDGDRAGWVCLNSTASQLAVNEEQQLMLTAEAGKELRSLATHFDPVSLAEPGDFVSVSFNVKHSFTGFVDRAFRVGLFDSANSQFSGDGVLQESAEAVDDTGFFALIDAGRSTTNASVLLRQTSNHSDARLWNGQTIAEDDNDTAADLLILPRGRNVTYTFTIRRQYGGTLSVHLTNDIAADLGQLVGTVPKPKTTSFDTLTVGAFSDGGELRLDNVRITSGSRLHRFEESLGKSRPIRVGVYIDQGASSSVSNVIRSLRTASDIQLAAFLTAEDIRNGKLQGLDVVVHPGGTGGGQGRHLGEKGRAAIQQHVKDGGGYVGICAGAYLATSHYPWSLHILDAKVVDTAHWARGHGMVELGLTESGQSIFHRTQEEMPIQYWQGPLLAPGEQPEIDDYETLATFRSEIAENGAPKGVMIGTTAIASGTFGKGRVLCFSPHPESTEGLSDFLGRAIRYITQPAELP